eukprot:1156951-Pelagomonas_calceolata.AAC.9
MAWRTCCGGTWQLLMQWHVQQPGMDFEPVICNSRCHSNDAKAKPATKGRGKKKQQSSSEEEEDSESESMFDESEEEPSYVKVSTLMFGKKRELAGQMATSLPVAGPMKDMVGWSSE